jgi:hypothetical protein
VPDRWALHGPTTFAGHLRRQGFCAGKKRKGILLDDIEGVNIDRLIDFQFAEFLISSGYLQKDHLQA